MAHDDEKMWAYITKSIVREDLKDFNTFEEFLQYHKTGSVPYGAYEKYKTLEGIEWLGTKDKYPTLISAMKSNSEVIELRADIEDALYVRKDEDGEIVRDAKGDALYLTPEEVKKRGYCPYMFSLVAFNEKDQPVGWASDEFGADGVWVAEEYQRKGIGTELLYQFRRFYPPKRKMGQMTDSGCGLVKSYYRRLKKETD